MTLCGTHVAPKIAVHVKWPIVSGIVVYLGLPASIPLISTRFAVISLPIGSDQDWDRSGRGGSTSTTCDRVGARRWRAAHRRTVSGIVVLLTEVLCCDIEQEMRLGRERVHEDWSFSLPSRVSQDRPKFARKIIGSRCEFREIDLARFTQRERMILCVNRSTSREIHKGSR